MMRNLLLVPTVLLTGFSALAQLYVAPNTSQSQDSYVYVNDNWIYVEDEIQLEPNQFDASTEASLYLRGDGQLIQGSNSDNSGEGFISVFQDSRSDSYDYNLWASPVSPAEATAGNRPLGIGVIQDADVFVTGDFTTTTAARSVSITPIGVKNGRGTGLGSDIQMEISGRWLYEYNSANSWQRINSGSPLSAGEGFTMKGTNVTNHSDPWEDPNNQYYDFRGRPNNGTFTINLPAADPSGGELGDNTLGEVLAGNPYPSAMDLSTFLAVNTNVQGIYFWDENRSINSHYYVDNQGGYGSWTSASGGIYMEPVFQDYDNDGNPLGDIDGDNGSGEDNLPRRYAPIGQGFIVRGTPSTTIQFDNTMRVYQREDGTNSIFRGSEDFEAQNQERPEENISSLTDFLGNDQNDISTDEIVYSHLHIYTHFSVNGGSSHYRDMVLMFNDEMTTGFDRLWDLPHPMDAGGGEAYFPLVTDSGARKMVMQTVPFDPDSMIPLNLIIDHQMKVGIEGVREVNLPRELYIWDSQEDTYQQFTGGKSAVYILPQGHYQDRFFIVFKSQREMQAIAEEFENAVRENIGVFQNNTISQLELSNPEGYDIKQANIFDINGRLVLSEMNVGNSRRYSFPTGNMSDGVYIVKLTTSDNVDLDYKISVYNKR
jgi:hypothetical protein